MDDDQHRKDNYREPIDPTDAKNPFLDDGVEIVTPMGQEHTVRDTSTLPQTSPDSTDTPDPQATILPFDTDEAMGAPGDISSYETSLARARTRFDAPAAHTPADTSPSEKTNPEAPTPQPTPRSVSNFSQDLRAELSREERTMPAPNATPKPANETTPNRAPEQKPGNTSAPKAAAPMNLPTGENTGSTLPEKSQGAGDSVPAAPAGSSQPAAHTDKPAETPEKKSSSPEPSLPNTTPAPSEATSTNTSAPALAADAKEAEFSAFRQKEAAAQKEKATRTMDTESIREDARLDKNIPTGEAPKDPLYAARVLGEEEAKKREGFPTQAPAPKPERPPQPLTRADASNVKQLRTFETDVAEALRRQELSVAQMVLAEERKKEKKEEAAKPTSKKNLPFVLLSGVLVVAGVLAISGGIFYAVTHIDPSAPPPRDNTPRIESIIFTEETAEIDTTEKQEEAVIAQARAALTEPLALDTIRNVYFTETRSRTDTLGDAPVRVLASAQTFFSRVAFRMPSKLIRSLRPQFMLGAHATPEVEPFLILRTDFFENAFAGMLEWEPFLADDVFPLFGIPTNDVLSEAPFEDRVIKNRDLRIITTDTGEIALLYTFFDKETAIITTNLATMDELITRLTRTGNQ